MTIPSAVRPVRLLRHSDMGCLLTCAQIWMRAAHTKWGGGGGGGGEGRHKHVDTRVDSERIQIVPHAASSGDRTRGLRVTGRYEQRSKEADEGQSLCPRLECPASTNQNSCIF